MMTFTEVWNEGYNVYSMMRDEYGCDHAGAWRQTNELLKSREMLGDIPEGSRSQMIDDFKETYEL